jgi:cystathionine gamma-synthase
MPHILTTLSRAGCAPDNDVRALSPPIHLATTFERDADESYPQGFQYGRNGSPTRKLLQDTLAALECGSGARAFSSGMAACNAVIQAMGPESHVIIPDDVYHGFRRLVYKQYAGRGVEVTSVDPSDYNAVAAAFRSNTRLLWIETPSNPLLRISNIAELSALAHERGAAVTVDSTWMTPLLQRPIELGADIVVHSLTKYLSGHSDVLGGAVIANKDSDFFGRVDDWQRQAGAVLDPMSSWLTLRGIRTLGVRLPHQCTSAGKIASFLETHPRVEKVHYPGLKGHPGHELAGRQMSAYGAMLSFEVGSAANAMRVAAEVRVFARATSLGGTESLIEHRVSMEGPGSKTPPGLLRLSIGLEHCEDLLKDLDAALSKV